MRKITSRILLSISGIFLLPVIIFAQILNPGFENWTGIYPDNWYVNNIQGLYVPCTQSNTSHSGSYALQGQVVNFLTAEVSPVVVSGGDGAGFSVSEKYLSLNGFYQLNSVGGDQLSAVVIVYRDSTIIGGNGFEIPVPASIFTPFSMDIEYYQDLVPDMIFIEFAVTNSSSDSIHIGTTFLLDDLALSLQPTSVEIVNTGLPASVVLSQNYPNPFNPSTMISFSLSAADEVEVTVYDMAGRQVATVIDRQEMTAGLHQVQWMPNKGIPSGLYFYRLTTGSFNETKRMLYLK